MKTSLKIFNSKLNKIKKRGGKITIKPRKIASQQKLLHTYATLSKKAERESMKNKIITYPDLKTFLNQQKLTKQQRNLFKIEIEEAISNSLIGINEFELMRCKMTSYQFNEDLKKLEKNLSAVVTKLSNKNIKISLNNFIDSNQSHLNEKDLDRFIRLLSVDHEFTNNVADLYLKFTMGILDVVKKRPSRTVFFRPKYEDLPYLMDLFAKNTNIGNHAAYFYAHEAKKVFKKYDLNEDEIMHDFLQAIRSAYYDNKISCPLKIKINKKKTESLPFPETLKATKNILRILHPINPEKS